MDFLIELILQFIGQIVVEVIFEAVQPRLARAFRTRLGRYALAALVGGGFGLGWGWHLTNQPHPPKLLWVSILLAVAATVLAQGKRGTDDGSASVATQTPWRVVLTPPTRWSSDRWIDFVVLNLAMTAGILGGYYLG